MVETAFEVESEAAALAEGGIGLHRVSRRLGGKTVLDRVDLDVGGGQRLAIVGRSGAGKSTLLALVAGLDEPDEGEVSVCGERSAAGRLGRCALMPQRDCLLPWRSALDNACLALENRGLPRRLARAEAAPHFARLGLGGAEELRPAHLSGGMRQRVAFLRTLLSGKQVLLLDEPFGALDAITRGELQEWLVAVLDDDPRTTLLVTHDVEEALLLCQRVVVLSVGGIALELDVELPERESRRELVTSPHFVALREQALEAIG
jgi:ABC-type nitrate/sulfonate/bicarbonate transport system ATPase subunit